MLLSEALHRQTAGLGLGSHGGSAPPGREDKLDLKRFNEALGQDLMGEDSRHPQTYHGRDLSRVCEELLQAYREKMVQAFRVKASKSPAP